MRSRWFVLAVCALVLAFHPLVQAGYCPDPVVVQCGDLYSGDNTGGPMLMASYPCLSFTESGPEAHHLFVLDECAYVEITMSPSGWDGALAILPSDNGTCWIDDCLAGSDGSGDEMVYGDLSPGNYYVVVDSWRSWEYGPYTLDFACTPYPCTDNDGDGAYALSGSCPCSTDCNDNDPAVRPGLFDPCGDGVDQDCDSVDPSCPSCSQTHTLDCDQSGTVNLASLSNNIQDYCGEGRFDWTGNEAIFAFTPSNDVFTTFSTVSGEDVDIAVLFPAGGGACDPDTCIAFTNLATGNEQVEFWAFAGWPYYIAVDGWDGVSPSFDWTASCLDEACTVQDNIVCGTSDSASSTGQANNVLKYAGLSFDLPGPEYVYTFTRSNDGIATLVLDWQANMDLDLLVLEESGQGCNPGDLIAISAYDNVSSGIYEEALVFGYAAGLTYYIVIDGYTASDHGPFNLRLDCEAICPAGTSDCGGVCINTTDDVNNCGGCGNVCALPNAVPACQASGCVVASCQPTFGNCNGIHADGCETPLFTDENCSGCGDACIGIEFCWQGNCTDQCPGGLTNCGGVCIDIDTDPLHCGGCNTPCSYAHASATCVARSCVMGACDANWGDCNPSPADGCETDLLSTPDHCGTCGFPCGPLTPFCVSGGCTDQCPGGLTNCSMVCIDTSTDMDHCGQCDRPCALDHASESCLAGTCTLGSCDPGWGDCNASAADGCELPLGTDLNCSACGDACNFANATGSCTAGACAMGACDAGFADCNASTADGCEAQLGTPEHCGSCGDACDFDHADGSCVAGACTIGSCYTGWEDCNANPADGCEADLDSRQTCGTCTNTCAGTDACTDGQCVSNCPDRDGDGALAESCGGDDCNDFDPQTYPGAPEQCGDGIDQDCSGADLPCGNCHDLDGDGFQDDTCGGVDCNDSDPGIHPGVAEICGDAIDQDCDGSDETCTGCEDSDGDGHSDQACGGSDCNDQDASIYPGALEVCEDGIDQDCSGSDETCGGCEDNDGDGHAPIACGGLDCDDNAPLIHPGAEDLCGDGIDQDCDRIDPVCPASSGCGCGTPGGSAPPSALLGLLFVLEYRRRRRR